MGRGLEVGAEAPEPIAPTSRTTARRTRRCPAPLTSISSRSNSVAIRASARTDAKSLPSPSPFSFLPWPPTTLRVRAAVLSLVSFLAMNSLRPLRGRRALQIGAQGRGRQAHQVPRPTQVTGRQDGARQEVLRGQETHHQGQL